MANLRILLLLLCFCTVACRAAEVPPKEPLIYMGMTREQVQDALGYPEANATAGVRTILFFKEGARFEFEKGILISVRGYKGQIDFSAFPLDKGHTAAVSETPKPVAAHPPTTGPKPQADAPLAEQKVSFMNQDTLANYRNIMKPAVTALDQVTRFFFSIYNPEIFNAKQQLQQLGLPILAGLVRILMTFFALRYAIRQSDHDLDGGAIAVLASSEWLLRLTLATVGVFVMEGGFPLLASELGTALVFWILISRRPELHGFGLSLRIMLFAKLAVLVVSFVLFMILLSLSA